MLLIKIQDKTYEFKSKQSEITVAIDREIQEALKNYPCNCNPIFQAECLSILSGCSMDEALLVDETMLARLIGTHPYFANDIRIPFKEFIKHDNKVCRYIDFTKPMTVKTFYELDFMSINEMDIYFALFQPIKIDHVKYYFRSYSKNKSQHVEDHKNYMSYLKRYFRYRKLKSIQEVDNVNYIQHKIAIYAYYKWKKDLLIEYGLSMDNDGIPAEQKPDQIVLSTSEKYGLYGALVDMCENNYTEVEKWLDRDIRDLLKYLSYCRIKTIEENAKIIP